ncbi:MAG: ABC transporter ATP-binding protein [Candidatus Eisenbacteria bacterium]|nr:ABC transporter ATP-binding protein [Candidatus Eisenbacteria bacterium]
MMDANARNEIVLRAEGLRKIFPSGAEELHVLRGVDLAVARGEIVSIVGASGAGKSTLLHICGALLRPTSGLVRIGGEDVFRLKDGDLSRLRNRRVGFVFQFHHLLGEFTAEENVMLPLLIAGGRPAEARTRAREILDAVSLSARLHHLPADLSGGEQQRVAVARALVARPDIVLADEPSGNLDETTSEDLHRLLWALRDEHGQAFVLVTHDESLADRADRKLRLHDGRVSEAGRRSERRETIPQ